MGLGYVGLPLAVEMGGAGMRVLGFDVSERVVNTLNEGISHIKDVPDAAIKDLSTASLLEATTNLSRIGECDVISIRVPIP